MNENCPEYRRPKPKRPYDRGGEPEAKGVVLGLPGMEVQP